MANTPELVGRDPGQASAGPSPGGTARRLLKVISRYSVNCPNGSSRAARRGPGARRRGLSRAGDRRRDLDRNVPDAALQQSGRLAELVVPFWVVLVLGRVSEGFGELVDETFGRRPLANRLAGFRGHLEHVPEPGIAPGLRLAEVHISRVQRVQRLGDLGQLESRPQCR